MVKVSKFSFDTLTISMSLNIVRSEYAKINRSIIRDGYITKRRIT